MKQTTYKNMLHKYSIKERTSLSGSKGIITVEASLVMPLFMFALLTIIAVIEIYGVRIKIHTAAANAGKAAVETIAETDNLNTGKLKNDIIKNIGNNNVNSNFIAGGVCGISCDDSYYSKEDGEVLISVKYDIRLPFPEFAAFHKRFNDEFKLRAWNGYYNVRGNPDEDEIVYVTKNGSVYHTDHNCTYLKPAIHYVPYDSIDTRRNKSGKRYKKCDKCVRGESVSGVYVTDYGDCYHNSVKCSSLKRTVYAVKKSDIVGKGECSKCSQ